MLFSVFIYLFIYYTGFFVVHIYSWRHINYFLGEQTWKTISHIDDVVNFFYLLYINWINWDLLDGFKSNQILVITNILLY